jgi:hypothetical protein
MHHREFVECLWAEYAPYADDRVPRRRKKEVEMTN